MRWFRWCANLLGQFEWFRRRSPGHWELWRLPRDRGTAWLRTSACFYARGRGPDARLNGPPLKCCHVWDEQVAYVDRDEIFEMPEIMMCPVCLRDIRTHARQPPESIEPPEILPVYRVCTGQLVRLRPWGFRKSGVHLDEESG